MIKIVPKKEISAFDIKYFREISGKSIAEIKKCSQNGESVRCFYFYENDWQDERAVLASISKTYSQQVDVPFYVILSDDEYLSPSQLHRLLLGLRAQELEEQKNSDLENGFISSCEAFEPHDEDWML